MLKLITLCLFLILTSCGSDVSKIWNFEWSYLNDSDSSNVLVEFEPKVDIKSNQFDPSAENLFFSQKGKLTFSVYIQGSDSYVYDFQNNANLHVQLSQNDSVCFDTLFQWNELEFIKGEDAEGNKNQDVNYQTFYISGL